MTSKLPQEWTLPPQKLRLFIIIILIMGLFFRFSNFDQRAYTSDEVRSLLHTSGYTSQELIDRVFNGNIISIEDLQHYQHPNSEKDVIDTIKSVEFDALPHSPLYFLILRYWMEYFGNSEVATHSLSGVISLITFPAVYWLCMELFNSSLTGWIAIALIAVSPFHLVVNVQEVRPYSLWTVGILLSSAALLRAARIKTSFSWIFYATTVGLGIYTHIYFTFVAIAHAIYLIVIERFRLSKTVIAYILASLASIVVFMPWILVILNNRSKIQTLTNWATSYHISLLERIRVLIYNISNIFLDLNYEFNPRNIFPYLLLLLVIYSIYVLCRNTPKKVWLFVVLLIGVTAIVQILPDLIWGGRRAIVARYLTPSYLGIQLAVAYLLTVQTTSISVSLKHRRFWQFVMVMLILAGILSCAVISQAKSGRTQGSTPPMNLKVAHIINQASQPLAISDNFYPYILSLSHLLDKKVKLYLVKQPDITRIPDGFKDMFLYHPSPNFKNEFSQQQKYNLEVLVAEPEKGRFWVSRITKQNADNK